MEQPTVESLDVRERILLEATRLFAQKGYGSTSVRELVEAAGVTKPTLYYYFGSKEGLFLETVNTHLRGLDTLVEQTLNTPGTVRERLATFARTYVDGGLQNPDSVRLLMTLTHPSTGDQPEVDLMTMHLRKIELLNQLVAQGIAHGELRPDIDLQTAVITFIGTLNLYLMAGMHQGGLPPDYADAILDIYFNGVAAR
jgi:AcrR family transcriptional regulator